MTDGTLEDEKYAHKGGSKGRTWADVFVNASYIITGLLFLVFILIAAYFLMGEVPTWFFIAVLSSLIFIPFLQERAKDGTDLFMISDEPFKLTEYRIGRKVGIEIEGNGTQFMSNSGVYRMLLTDFNLETKTGKGSMFGELSQIDQVRDMTTLSRAVKTLEATLRESRISAQEVGVEVEKQSIAIVDWALKTIYGAIIPTEISEAFGVEESKEPLEVDSGLDAILEEAETI